MTTRYVQVVQLGKSDVSGTDALNAVVVSRPAAAGEASGGLDWKSNWGSDPGGDIRNTEYGELKCNFLATRFVRKTLKDALATLVARLLVKTQLQEAAENNKRLEYYGQGIGTPPMSPPLSSAGLSGRFPSGKQQRFSTQTAVSEMDGSQGSQRGQKSPRWMGGQHPSEGPVELP